MDKLSSRCPRFPSIVIQQAVWLYFRFALSYRDVEDMLAERGIDVSYETVRRWALKFGGIIARQLRRGPGHPRSTTARPQGGAQADAKTPEEAGRHSSHRRDRQARILQLCAARTWCCAAARHRSLEE